MCVEDAIFSFPSREIRLGVCVAVAVAFAVVVVVVGENAQKRRPLELLNGICNACKLVFFAIPHVLLYSSFREGNPKEREGLSFPHGFKMGVKTIPLYERSLDGRKSEEKRREAERKRKAGIFKFAKIVFARTGKNSVRRERDGRLISFVLS